MTLHWPTTFCKLDDRRRSYDVILILQDGGRNVAILLPVSGLAMSNMYEGPSYRRTKFPPYVFIHGRYITTSGFEKQRAGIV